MPRIPNVWNLAARIPGLVTGTRLHHWGLRALHEGRYGEAELLFERAAAQYRRELGVERLARLRVHQLMGRVRALESPERQAELGIEVERLLARLERIESLEPPFPLVDASSLLATWLTEAPAKAEERVEGAAQGAA
jgi:hypothetical protein